MAQLSLTYPVTPHIVNRAWGVLDPLYKEFGFLRHNGVDLALVEGQEIRAPFDCRVTLVDNQPHGSGIFVCLLSQVVYDFPDGIHARVELTFMHLLRAGVSAGTKLAAGDVFAYGGHTGRTTGPHTHMAPKRVKRSVLGYRDLDRNDANNTFDPEPYWKT